MAPSVSYPLTAIADGVAKSVASIGISLSSCTVPGQSVTEHRNRIGDDEVELGLGIHGEPGASIVAWQPVRDLATMMMGRIENALSDKSSAIALLVNDLGGVPPIELAICAKAALAATSREVKLVFGPGRYMTSLDMKGFSISALPISSPEIETALVSSVGPRAWPVGRDITRVEVLPLPIGLRSKEEASPSSNPERRRMVERMCDALIANQRELDALDAKVGDGDTGTTFATAARVVKADLDRLPFADLAKLFTALSDRLSRAMGGSSGILLAIFTAAVAAHLEAKNDGVASLREGIRRMQEYGGAKPGDRTMLDALCPAIRVLEEGGDLARAAVAAREGARHTASMTKARAGRSSYVPDAALKGTPDPGAIAVAVVFESFVITGSTRT